MKRLSVQSLRFFLCLLVSAHLQAQEEETQWPLCPTSFDIPPRPVVEVELEPGDTHVTADQADLVEEGLSHLEGNVEITRDNQQASADVVDYNQPADNADLHGNVNYWDETVYLHGDSAHLEFDTGTGTMNNAEYRLPDRRGRGKADELFIDFGSLSQGKNVDYTTCDPEDDTWDLTNNVWKLSAREMTLNHETDRGTGKHVVLKIKDIPVFYTPYITFPLSLKRKSGFLMPALGTSNNNGFEFRTPYYWNIAPNMDATLTPRLITKSGMMAMGEYRYLFSRGTGHINLEYLPGDDNFNNKDRNLIEFEHEQTFLKRGNIYLAYNRVSDTEYLEDFGTQLTMTSQRYLPRRAEVSYMSNWWNVTGRVQDYQTIDNSIAITSDPYKRLPQIQFNASPLRGINKINLKLQADFSYFDRDKNDIDGFRADLYPSVSYPLQTRATFFKPKIGVRYTQYSLHQSGTFKSSPSRVLPIFSVDTGAFFERDTKLFESDYLQTLEPRIYYLYIPDEDQTNLPVFDTGILNLSYNQLFREDRFTGVDRVGDANQVTLAVTTRLIDQATGQETAYLRIGQEFLLSDQDVIRQRLDNRGRLVDNGMVNTDLLAPFIVEYGMTLIKDWELRGDFHWDPNDNVTQKLSINAQYNPAAGKVLNLGYRVRRAESGIIRQTTADIDQSDISFRWPINGQWSVLGRWNYAISEGKSLELFGGIEYESCCWGMRAVARRFLTNLNGDFQTGIFLQFELKGLAGLGRKTVDFLNQKIPGYKSEF